MTTPALGAMLLDRLRDAYPGDDMRVSMVPGQTLVNDWCWSGCGQAFVRLDQAYPSRVFPTPDAGLNVGSLLAARFHVGVARCIQGPSEDAEPPDPDRQTADALALAADAQIVWRVLCEASQDPAVDHKHVQLGSWQPMGPFGDCAGGYWTWTARVIR